MQNFRKKKNLQRGGAVPGETQMEDALVQKRGSGGVLQDKDVSEEKR